MKSRALCSFALTAALVCAGFSVLAFAEDTFPSKPVRIIVPAIGGTLDLVGRLIAPKLSESLGQPVIVENKPGGGGNIGTDLVAKSKPDGYALLIGYNGPIAVNVTLFDKLPYDPLKDLTPITLAVSTSQFLVVHPSVPVSSVAEFIAYVKARPGKLSYGSIGVGGASHLTMEMLKFAAGINMVHVPYKGAGPAMNDLLAGTVQAGFFVAANALPYMRSGQLRLLASTGRNRLVSTPNVPTLIESGFPDFEAIAWIGVLTTGGTPKSIIDRYHSEIVRILNLPDIRARLRAAEFEVIGSTPEEFAHLIRSEISRWGRVIKETGARAD